MTSKPLIKFRKIRYKIALFYRRLSKNKYQYSISPMDAVTIFGHSFSPNKNHFLIQFLKEERKGVQDQVQRSAIDCFHSEFCPTSTSEALSVSLDKDLPLFVYPWGVFGSGAIMTDKNPQMSRFCGPSTSAFLTEEKNRMRQLSAELENDGYRPDKYPHSYIQGVWLISNGGRRKFVVLQGNHRMAALSFLGYTSIDVRTDLFTVREIRESEVLSWPLVEAGAISAVDALKIFRHFFSHDK